MKTTYVTFKFRADGADFDETHPIRNAANMSYDELTDWAKENLPNYFKGGFEYKGFEM